MTNRYQKDLSGAIAAIRGGLFATGLFSFFINLLLFVSPIYMMQVYDRVLSSRSIPTLVGLTIIAGGLLLVMAMLDAIRARVMLRASNKFDANLRDRVFEAVFRRSLSSPAGSHGQSLRDLDALRSFMGGPAFTVFCDAPWTPLFLAVAFMLHPVLGLVSLAGAVVIAIIALLNEILTRRHLEAANGEAVQAATYAETSLRNAEAIAAMGMLPNLGRRWLLRHASMLSRSAVAGDRASFLLAVSKSIRQFLQIAILGTGAWLAINGELTPGAIMAASIIMGRALAPIEMAVGQWKSFVNARTAWKRLGGVLEDTPKLDEAMRLPDPKGEIVVERVMALPPGAKLPAIRNISFALEPGDVLGIVGPSAAGKSTLARVLAGAWPHVAGSLRLDGNELGNWNQDQLGRHMGYLPQDVELFDGSVAENIARFGAVEAEKIVEAAMRAGVHEMILRLPQGYDTQIGPGGMALSGGQRQRVGLARAIFGDPKLIVLDEPNSNLDTMGEQALIGAIHNLREREATTVIVTHRLSVLGAVNKVLVMREGQVEMFGPRDEVLQRLSRPQVVRSQPQPAAMSGPDVDKNAVTA